MKPRLAAVIALALAIPAFSGSASAQDAASKKATSLGDTIELGIVSQSAGDLAWGRAEAVVDARSEAVLAILSDYSQYAGIFPYFEKSKVLSQRGSDAIVYLEAEVLNGAATLWSQVRMSAKVSGTTTIVEARMMKGKGNIEQMLARWEVTPVAGGEKSLVAFQLLVDPDLPIPDVLVTGEMKKGAGQAMRALRKRVAERGSFASRPATSM
jgi:ribosome-associated toxin RatA of RatAB toxin-antitoxin module